MTEAFQARTFDWAAYFCHVKWSVYCWLDMCIGDKVLEPTAPDIGHGRIWALSAVWGVGPPAEGKHQKCPEVRSPLFIYNVPVLPVLTWCFKQGWHTNFLRRSINVEGTFLKGAPIYRSKIYQLLDVIRSRSMFVRISFRLDAAMSSPSQPYRMRLSWYHKSTPPCSSRSTMWLVALREIPRMKNPYIFSKNSVISFWPLIVPWLWWITAFGRKVEIIFAWSNSSKQNYDDW